MRARVFHKSLGLGLTTLISFWPSEAKCTSILAAAASVNPGTSSPDPTVDDGGFGATSAFATQTSVFGSSTFVGSASAMADFGSVGAFASTTLTNYQPGSFTTVNPPFPTSYYPPANGEAGFQDTLTITGGPGTAGFLYLGFTAEGSNDNADAIIDIFDGGWTGTLVASTVISNSGFVSAVLPFTYGTPFTFSHTLYVATDVFSLDLLSSSPYDYSGFADFSSTSRLTEFSVFSDAGLQNEVVMFDLLTESGVDYRTLVSVPEPSVIWLLAFGLGVVARIRHRI